MGFYEFPHTRNYDTDLGYLIRQYKKATDLINNLNQHISEIILNLLKEEKLLIGANYYRETETLEFVFTREDN